MYTVTEPGQVNAIGYDEKIVRVKVPEEREDQEEGPRPQLVNVQLEPTKTTTTTTADGGRSTVSDFDHYNTYWVSDSDRRGATDRATKADTDVVLIGSDRPLDAVQKSSVDKRLLLVVDAEGKEEEDEGDDGYNDRSGNRYDVNRPQSMRPPLPVQSSSARPGNHSPSGLTRVVKILCLLPFSYFAVHILSWSSS